MGLFDRSKPVRDDLAAWERDKTPEQRQAHWEATRRQMAQDLRRGQTEIDRYRSK